MKLTCLIIEDEPLARSLIENFAKRTNKVTVLEQFEDLDEAFNYLERIEYGVDFIFLDVLVKQKSSILMLAQTGKDKEVQIVFVSAFPPNLFKNYDIQYFEWLQKPIPYQDFEEVIQKLHLDKTAKFGDDVSSEEA
ncbi:response regulator receiver domain-containing protein [Arcicella aurantiaca]|uniref:Response regulator receiver domain-containing protein n=1 Tax=Arcicella aurantiaca TaxID=591202 RepID=A0A316E2L5_9BACT|nr:response regulator [Arcicella aurantiaca]PWK23888.1 response regulator receiver domain-containing protein [Arcicella aurantiaca]